MAGRLASAIVLAVVALIVSCTDETMVGPEEHNRDLTPRYLTEVLGGAAIPAPATNTLNKGALGWTATGVVVPDSSYIRLRLDGVVTLGTNPLYLAAFPGSSTPPLSGMSVPAWGKSYGELRVGVRVSGQTVTFHENLREGAIMEALVWVAEGGPVEVMRSGVSGSSTCYSDSSSCYGGTEQYTAGHYTLQSNQSIQVSRVDIPATLHASRTRIEAYDTVTFTADVDGTVLYPKIRFVEGDTLPQPANYVPRGGYQALIATMNVARSGRAYLQVQVDHLQMVVPSEVVWVRQPGDTFPSLELTADRHQVAPGEVVTFTAGLSDSATAGAHNLDVQSWTWSDSTGAQTAVCPENGSVCATPVGGSGSMSVSARVYGTGQQATVGIIVTARELVVSASPNRIVSGSIVRFEAAASGGPPSNLVWRWNPDSLQGEAVACPAGAAACDVGIQESGWMVATGDVGGVACADSAHVDVVCEYFTDSPQDSLLSDTTVHRIFSDLWRRSNGGDSINGVEQGGYLIRRNGRIEFYDFQAADRDICGIYNYALGEFEDFEGIDGQLVGVVHTHPLDGGSSPNLNNCRGVSGRLHWFPGPSVDDWLYIRRVQEYRDVRAYIIDPDEVYEYRYDENGNQEERRLPRNPYCRID